MLPWNLAVLLPKISNVMTTCCGLLPIKRKLMFSTKWKPKMNDSLPKNTLYFFYQTTFTKTSKTQPENGSFSDSAHHFHPLSRWFNARPGVLRAAPRASRGRGAVALRMWPPRCTRQSRRIGGAWPGQIWDLSDIQRGYAIHHNPW